MKSFQKPKKNGDSHKKAIIVSAKIVLKSDNFL